MCSHGEHGSCWRCRFEDELEASGRSLERSAREPSGEFTQSEPMEHDEGEDNAAE